ncbi:MAG TPA: hypothetical protein ENN34_06295 [Deltaproteobacteria bacterium]|nr:hypothetical protein [Deltaproteobacteria bacterium]
MVVLITQEILSERVFMPYVYGDSAIEYSLLIRDLRGLWTFLLDHADHRGIQGKRKGSMEQTQEVYHVGFG